MEFTTLNNEIISVIVPVYKVEDYLDQCIESIGFQTYPYLDIILVDDGSPDSCPEICDRWAERDERIRVIHKENGGVSEARNTGITAAKGSYLFFVDGDDWIDSACCEEAIHCAREQSADIVMWSYVREFENASKPKLIYAEDRIFQGEECLLLARKMAGAVGDELRNPTGTDSLAPVCCKLYKTSLISEHKLKFVDLKEIGVHEDGLFNLEAMALADKVVFLNRHWYHYRKGVRGQNTRSYRPELFEQYQKLITMLANKGAELSIPEIDTAIENYICLSMIPLSRNICRASIPFKEKVTEIRRMLSTPKYRASFRHFAISGMPIHWKLFFYCCKRCFSNAVAALAEITLRL
ncbi:MAG: glycosyltransferase [Oscillospiraceae bacterium]|nr:glycosyltransferase [Oscillospiraceae bacterium]